MQIIGKRSLSSRLWLNRQLKDVYVKQARDGGYRSRAVFKLMEIDDKFRIIKNTKCIIDLGAAPGSWCQLLSQRSSDTAKIVAIDLLDFSAVEKVQQFVGNFEDEKNQVKIMDYLRQKADLIVSDMASATSGHAQTDHLRIMQLACGAYSFAQNALQEGGSFVTKIFQGGREKAFFENIKKDFQKARFFKPKASRNLSSEIYIVATGFKTCN
ncbi:MAG: RlmE family RNA methyltransferase [Holosporaceae bacterium]|jgi:23S rRNA (uridine2552-2'-O)-methyltransferase|nr:RlmE family RNA methyltransferase [Holosporaceae bacterium]